MIGGNTYATLQMDTVEKNEFGETVHVWNDVQTIRGFLDYTGGDASYKSTYKGAIEETTHLFICDYVELLTQPTRCRLLCDNKKFDILMMDDPMSLHKHLEFFLKYNEVV